MINALFVSKEGGARNFMNSDGLYLDGRQLLICIEGNVKEETVVMQE